MKYLLLYFFPIYQWVVEAWSSLSLPSYWPCPHVGRHYFLKVVWKKYIQKYMSAVKTEFGDWICLSICSYNELCPSLPHCYCLMLDDLSISSGLLHWHWGNHLIAPLPVKWPWRIWVNTVLQFTVLGSCNQNETKHNKTCISYMIYVLCDDIKQYDDADRGAFLLIIFCNSKTKTIWSNLKMPLMSTQKDRNMQLEKCHVFRLYFIFISC